MKTIAALILMVMLALPAFAQDDMQGMGNEPQQQGGGMMGGGPGKGKMGGMMNKDSVVATSDGGVVVMSGPRLIKYDKDLNLIKAVELPRGKKPSQLEAKTESSESTPSAS